MSWAEKNESMRDALRSLNKANRNIPKGFGAMSQAAMEGDLLDGKTKEMVALSIAIGVRCEPCVGFHVEALAKQGASREELAEMLAMCVQMGGGPVLMYAAKALEAWDELTA
ncbi:carboxymuconolactone decarboxylase family protein [Celeribacter marinus]|uniref:Putative carboxymuconolactone decarboxylase family protein n=1 Tax=Celeribacter marinus TaxID=1397108 RepID=A0A0P0AEZ2_9RHOB|nr:carboxymuconolactone decarboxylase family protein [Celeribacter marinus]ALI56916.1 putative carboxymuconolactone decarboxylase family protein [Celeribacter marinus]SFK68079.1 alkylhydroperoxidase AhpD family core domain-containing protein [Celeribacter marinus]